MVSLHWSRGYDMISSSDNRTGEIFRLTTLGSPRVFISSHELVDEVCNEERFGKVVTQGLKEIRNGTHDGLFTANYPPEENWAIAHRILVPAFGPLMIREMFDGKVREDTWCRSSFTLIPIRHVRHCNSTGHEMGAPRPKGTHPSNR